MKRKQQLIYGSIFDICFVYTMIMVKYPKFEYVWLKTKSNKSKISTFNLFCRYGLLHSKMFIIFLEDAGTVTYCTACQVNF